jgi:CRP-like cAMP-binding protein
MVVPKFVGESAIWKNIFSGLGVKKGSTEEVLRNVPAFSELNARELKEVAAIVHRREYRSGEPVFAQGDPGLGMYIIQDGEVSILLEDKEGRKRELAVLTDGDFFGELGLLDESPRSATAVCRTDCLLIGFFRPDLFELIERKPGLGIKIVLKLSEIVAARLRKVDTELSRAKHQLEILQSQQGGSDGTNKGS